MIPEFDLFHVFRWGLAIVCTVYSAIRIWQTLWRWLDYFASSRETAVVGQYVAVQLLRLKVRRFSFELVQIIALLTMLCWIVYLHRGAA